MKKLIACLLALLLCGAAATAEIGTQLRVVNCDEYVTLREEPDTSSVALARISLGERVTELDRAGNGFMRVCWKGQTGYVLERYLLVLDEFRGDTVNPSDDSRYNLNLFLSNFTEAGFQFRGGSYHDDEIDTVALTEFAINHCWFNRQNRLEWGEYFDCNNVRLPESQIAPIVEKYFGLEITPSHRLNYIDYRNGYYYWEETGGHTNDGFACLTRVEKLGGRRYSVWFEIYGMGENWNNDVCYYTTGRAARAYPPYSDAPTGHAVINVGSGGLGDRSTWSLERYTVNYDW